MRVQSVSNGSSIVRTCMKWKWAEPALIYIPCTPTKVVGSKDRRYHAYQEEQTIPFSLGDLREGYTCNSICR